MPTIATAISINSSGETVLLVGAGGNCVNGLSLDDPLSPGILAEVQVRLGATDAKTALSIAILFGNGIVGLLKALKSSAELPGHKSLVSNLTDLTINGTRILRLNLHVDTNRTISLIDGLVAKSGHKNANLISSYSPNMRISKTRFGGSIDVAPQPLDSTGLNLVDITLLTYIGADDALSRIETDINTEARRGGSQVSLQRAIALGNFSDQMLSSLVASLRGDGLPLETLVNIVG